MLTQLLPLKLVSVACQDSRRRFWGGQVILPLAHTVEHEEGRDVIEIHKDVDCLFRGEERAVRKAKMEATKNSKNKLIRDKIIRRDTVERGKDITSVLEQEEILDETDKYVDIHKKIKVNMNASKEKVPDANLLQPSQAAQGHQLIRFLQPQGSLTTIDLISESESLRNQ
ncbi:hypothetical protein RJT34_20146 [Clitoria ternatea]|uniref:Uncharacterized protein n=1 Tax=Clitoria ternatea TaxID=43366 RepID=A0AAN9P4T0_CLITE